MTTQVSPIPSLASLGTGWANERPSEGLCLISDWLISIAALLWLITIAVFDIRERRVPHPLWTGVPMLVAAVYRLVVGQHQVIVAAAAVVVLVSERRHLQQKLLETIILVAGILVLGWLLFWASSPPGWGSSGSSSSGSRGSGTTSAGRTRWR